jgi:DNA-binding Lrp family transcriptional regulator
MDINSMPQFKLDNIDLEILKILQEEGRITNVQLAERVGITAPPCLRRVRALEDACYIKGYHADLNANSLGYDLVVFAMVGLHSQAETDLQAFEEMVGEWPMVREAFMLNGEIDFILKIVARDLNHFQTFLTTHLTPAPNVASVKTSLTIRCGKNRPGIPFTPDAVFVEK